MASQCAARARASTMGSRPDRASTTASSASSSRRAAGAVRDNATDSRASTVDRRSPCAASSKAAAASSRRSIWCWSKRRTSKPERSALRPSAARASSSADPRERASAARSSNATMAAGHVPAQEPGPPQPGQGIGADVVVAARDQHLQGPLVVSGGLLPGHGAEGPVAGADRPPGRLGARARSRRRAGGPPPPPVRRRRHRAPTPALACHPANSAGAAQSTIAWRNRSWAKAHVAVPGARSTIRRVAARASAAATVAGPAPATCSTSAARNGLSRTPATTSTSRSSGSSASKRCRNRSRAPDGSTPRASASGSSASSRPTCPTRKGLPPVSCTTLDARSLPRDAPTCPASTSAT